MRAQGDPQAFTDYLKSYGNTICGRHPISVFLNVRCLTTSNAFPAPPFMGREVLFDVMLASIMAAQAHHWGACAAIGRTEASERMVVGVEKVGYSWH